jgi:hypothetical protein
MEPGTRAANSFGPVLSRCVSRIFYRLVHRIFLLVTAPLTTYTDTVFLNLHVVTADIAPIFEVVLLLKIIFWKLISSIVETLKRITM